MRKTLKKNIRSQYILQLAKYILPFITLPYLTRVLGADAYSIRVYVLSIMTIMQTITDFGFVNYGTRLITEARLKKEKPSSVFSCILNAKIIVIAVSFVIIAVLIFSIPILFNNALFVVISFLCVVVNTLLPDYIFQGFEKMSAITKRYVLAKTISTFLIFLLIHNPADLLLVPICDLVGSFIALVWSFWYVVTKFDVTYERHSWKGIAVHLKNSFQYFSISFCSTMLNSFSIGIVGLLDVSAVELSVWSISLSLINAVQSLYTPIINSLYPNSLMNKDFKIVRSISMKALPIVVLVILALMFLSPLIIKVLAGEEYASGSYLLTAISPLIIFSFYKAMYGWPVLGASGHVRQLGYATYLSAFVTVFFLLFGMISGYCNIEYVIVVRILSEAASFMLVMLFYFKYKNDFS